MAVIKLAFSLSFFEPACGWTTAAKQNFSRSRSHQFDATRRYHTRLGNARIAKRGAQSVTAAPIVMAATSTSGKSFKRICVLSDGTWQSQDNDVPTNILRLCMALQGKGADGVEQVTFYDPGIGTQQGLVGTLVGGAFGEGIDLNIQQLYTFLSLNYDEGDEVHLFGYSRGAYTVRSLCGLISIAGLVRRNHIHFVKEAYELYRRQSDALNEEAVAFRKEHGDAIPIKLLACFDTVGALGIPFALPGLVVNAMQRKRYEFHNTKLSSLIEHAVHVLSVDERRGAFRPTMMEPADPARSGQVTQRYFWGVHEGVGGGHMRRQQSAFCALRGLVEEIRKRSIPLSIDDDLLPSYDVTAKVELTFSDRATDGFFNLINVFTGEYIRHVDGIQQVHHTALTRYVKVLDWRPLALRSLQNEIMQNREQYE